MSTRATAVEAHAPDLDNPQVLDMLAFARQYFALPEAVLLDRYSAINGIFQRQAFHDAELIRGTVAAFSRHCAGIRNGNNLIRKCTGSNFAAIDSHKFHSVQSFMATTFCYCSDVVVC